MRKLVRNNTVRRVYTFVFGPKEVWMGIWDAEGVFIATVSLKYEDLVPRSMLFSKILCNSKLLLRIESVP